ncbi:MAG: TOBE domain-containing protein, partial [Clostridia bacterium]|nr:TOBE domain-containing protein [Clostridia bacterium]
EIIMGIRPEDVHNEDRLLEEYADCKVNADVEVTELMGAETFLYLNVEGFNFTARVEPTSTARPGDTIEIALENHKIHLFDKETERTICN